MNDPSITVIIPVYNTAKYLKACLDSVLSQSLADFEIVAVNDASTDDSPAILAEYAAKDARVRIVDHERNKGLLAARVSGVRAAAGKYLLFLDSDDIFLPGFLAKLYRTAERRQADVVHFPLTVRDRNHTLSERLIRLAARRSRPYPGRLDGSEVFRKFFVDNAYGWSAAQKMYRSDLCRRAVEFIPDDFCLMGEDFCFYTICAFFAVRYVPLRYPGYVYFLDSGISSGQQTSLEKYLTRQSPFQALRNVKDFLLRQQALDEYRAAFELLEQKLLEEYALRWMRLLPDEARARAFNTIFREYDPLPLFLAFRSFFSDKDERFLEMLTGEDPDPVVFPGSFERIAHQPAIAEKRISAARWREWKKFIENGHYDAVVLEPDEDLDRLFWDLRAIRDAGAAPLCSRTGTYLDTLKRNGLNAWLMEDRVLRQAAAVLVPDADSVEWYRKRNCRAGTSLENLQPPDCSGQTSAEMLALEHSERTSAYYRIDPSPDGETFVPFFRKLDHLFRKLPNGFRKKTFGLLARLYNRIRGY
ncbi:MAG: glycosyltransferase family 2 protein [Lentisphaeria bacterium]|nr:glycosyltransferase family 2 protein [Lentisphaeria bacterium]